MSMRAARLRELEEMAGRLLETARKLPPGAGPLQCVSGDREISYADYGSAAPLSADAPTAADEAKMKHDTVNASMPQKASANHRTIWCCLFGRVGWLRAAAPPVHARGRADEGPPAKGLVVKRTKAPGSRGYEESERGGDREIAW
jgi:hypothetical protein